MNMTLRELKENDFLINSIVEDLDDFSEDTKVTYEVWAIGYRRDCLVDGTELLLLDFTDPDEAIRYSRDLTLADVVQKAWEESDDEAYPVETVDYISIEVETVIDDNENGTMNIGTLYKKDLHF